MRTNGTQARGAFRARRRTLGLSQQRLAELAHCSVSMVRLLEAGYRPSHDSAVLSRIATVLETSEAPGHQPEAPQNTGDQARHAPA